MIGIERLELGIQGKFGCKIAKITTSPKKFIKLKTPMCSSHIVPIPSAAIGDFNLIDTMKLSRVRHSAWRFETLAGPGSGLDFPEYQIDENSRIEP